MEIDAEKLKEILETWPEYNPKQELISLYQVEEESWIENHRN